MSWLFEPLKIVLAALPATLPLLGLLLVLALACRGWGRSILGPAVGAGAEGEAIALVLGLAALGLGLFGLGLGGLLGAAGTLGVVIPGLVLGIPHGASFVGLPPRRWVVGLAASLAVVAMGTLLVYPLIGWDPAMYRLPTAQAFAESGSLVFVPELRFPVGPQLAEVLFAGALAVGDDHLARGVVFVALVSLVTLAYGWGRRLFGAAGGVATGALVMGSPGLVLFGTDAYVDVLQAAFTLAALALAERTRSSPRARLAFAAGALAGAGAATRYTGLLGAALIPLAILAAAPREHRRRVFLAAVAGALLVAGPWYLRTLWVTGNPLFPLLTGLFGPNDWDLGPLARLYDAESLGAFFLRLTLRAQDGPPLLNPWLLGLIPLAFWGAWRDPRLRLPVGLGAVLGLAVWAISPDPRFLLPAVAPLCLSVVGGATSLAAWPRLQKPAAGGLVALLLSAPGWLYLGFRLEKLGPVPRETAAVTAFLSTHIHGHGAVEALDRRGGPRRTVYAFRGERLRYYSRHRWLGDNSGPYRWDVVRPLLDTPAELARWLRNLGVDWFVWVRLPGREPAWLATGTADFVLVYRDAESWVYELSDPRHPAASVAATSSRISGVE